MPIMLSSFLTTMIMFSTLSVFVAIAVDFLKYDNKNDTKKSRKSIVATGTMVGFYIFYFLTIRFHIGSLKFISPTLAIFGTALVVSGAVINILGRLTLKNNWANHIKIYNGHQLMVTGTYRLVRHPLYASIMLMLLGGSIAYRNWLSAILTIFIFIPFMSYRAKQEENLLTVEFPEYADYKRETGMFFPKIRR